jgi:hypothetical protein
MRCPYCGKEINPGDECIETLIGMIEDTPVTLTGICPTCADAIEARGLVRCPACDGCGEYHGYGIELDQCSRCGGTGEVFGSVDDASADPWLDPALAVGTATEQRLYLAEACILSIGRQLGLPAEASRDDIQMAITDLQQAANTESPDRELLRRVAMEWDGEDGIGDAHDFDRWGQTLLDIRAALATDKTGHADD